MKIIKTIVLLCSLVLLSCKNDRSSKKLVNANLEDFKKSKYFDEERIKIDKYKVKYYGDVGAYSELSVYYSYNKLRKEEFLPYILLMVEKHKNYKYCTVAFDSFLEFYSDEINDNDGTYKSLILYTKNINKLNKGQKDYLLYFVNLGAINNNIESINLLETLYREGIGLTINLEKADSLKIVLEKINLKNK